MSILAVIPARYGSTRFPGKPLAIIGDKPLVVHVMEHAREAKRVDEVIVATDDARIVRAVEEYGGRAVMTSPYCATGSDRIAEVAAARPDVGIIVNIQGDEPLIPPEVIDQTVEALLGDPECAAATAMIRITNEQDYLSPNVVKVVCDRAGRALYFSRSPLPNLNRASAIDKGAATDKSGADFWGFKHFGLYAYRREALLRFVSLPPSPLEKMEKLEQLRFLENGMKIRVVETHVDSIGVDTPEDLEAARKRFEEKSRKQH
jgi:3-deoxy-manno-octulosonate cytidylyltransferase (CMP-KDO synthetase)